MRRTILATFALFALVVAGAPVAAAPRSLATIDPDVRAGEHVVLAVRGGSGAAVAAFARSSGADDVAVLAALDMVTARADGAALARLAADADVRAIHADSDIHALDLGEIEEPTGAPASPGVSVVNAAGAWAQHATGRGVGVALMDTGIDAHPDLQNRVKVRVDFVKDGATQLDPGGHGTHLAGVVAAADKDHDGFSGVAPEANLVSLRVLDAHGGGKLRTVLAAFDWLLRNARLYHVRVLNLSFGAPVRVTYNGDPLAAASEAAWFSGIVVVAAAGNAGAAGVVSPASDPFVITAGSLDDHGTLARSTYNESAFSGRGPTADGFAKPDILAPGRHVVSLRAPGSTIDVAHPDRVVKSPAGYDGYARMSGTSVSAAMVSGIAALAFSKHPSWGPNEVKAALVAGGHRIAGASAKGADAAGALVFAGHANAGLKPSALLIKVVLSQATAKTVRRILTPDGLRTLLQGTNLSWENLSWENLSWENLSWENLSWESISWESISWDSVSWENLSWDNLSWDTLSWEALLTE